MRKMLLILLFSFVLSPAIAQELILSTVAKTYNANEQVWVNLSILNASTLPGAYKIEVRFNPQKVKFSSILPSDKGPFTITPAISVNNQHISIAGFQGISDEGNGTVSLATLIFTPDDDAVTLDSSSFSVTSKEIFSTQALPINVTVRNMTTSVLLPSSQNILHQKISFTNGYIRFTLNQDGLTSVRIVDLKGRTVAYPLKPGFCKAGRQAVPVGANLRSGMYIITVNGAGVTESRKMEVVR